MTEFNHENKNDFQFYFLCILNLLKYPICYGMQLYIIPKHRSKIKAYTKLLLLKVAMHLLWNLEKI